MTLVARETRATVDFSKFTIRNKTYYFIVIVNIIFRIKINFTVALVPRATYNRIKINFTVARVPRATYNKSYKM